ncbi:Protein CCC1 [Escovopsis weberi]|uniref:Protein CCC1 n=1 Tax=Escovopsis weberi TaxID=150374 RepID=A0A0M8N197_ESCWE|nr:Protein CCC1 [Escovopsis weberi]
MAPKRSPWLARFLSDFTLGFSDGLTVPFALSAGLSSLGRTDTVIEAGVAELCAGSISMGIGGYLAARDELAAQHEPPERDDNALNEKGEELKGMLSPGSDGSSSLDEKRGVRRAGGGGSSSSSDDDDDENDNDDDGNEEQVIRQYLLPLALPRDLAKDVVAHLRTSGTGLGGVARSIAARRDAGDDDDAGGHREHQLPVTPIASGFFISIGYVVGGLIPLLPYIFTADVMLGLVWSIVVCLVALFLFGVGKTWLLRGGSMVTHWRQCLWEGTQMLVLGSLAAGASALCVMVLGSKSEAPVG